MNIETKLHVEISDEFEALSNMEVGSDAYKASVDGLTKLMDRAIEMEKINIDEKTKADNKEIELKKMKSENIDRIVKNVLTAVSVVGGIALTVWGTKTSIKFEETGTFTTIMGRGFVNKLLPKK
jgi:hypothetical protein